MLRVHSAANVRPMPSGPRSQPLARLPASGDHHSAVRAIRCRPSQTVARILSLLLTLGHAEVNEIRSLDRDVYVVSEGQSPRMPLSDAELVALHFSSALRVLHFIPALSS